MSEPVISVRDLGKCYRMGRQRPIQDGLRHVITDWLHGPFRRRPRRAVEPFWALRRVSFDVGLGEVLGIIGANGVGKTTLLKILGRITPPSEGQARLRGRAASLLEVGTGFHPELTGRENIYLNGAILGMRRREIARRFDEIVGFSEIEQFLETPVKRYSSGMYVRLAFAIAAHLEPDILLIDEVLAVGDAAFQKKCLGKMQNVAGQGRTVLFVSHNMSAIRHLCQRAVWLRDDHVSQIGEVFEVTESYLRESLPGATPQEVAAAIRSLPDDPSIRLKDVAVRQDGQGGSVVVSGRPVTIEIAYAVLARTPGLRLIVDVLDDERNMLIRTFNDEDAETAWPAEPGEYVAVAEIPADVLAPHTYEIRVQGTVHNVRMCTGEGVCLPLIVKPSGRFNRGYPDLAVRSKLQLRIPWRTERRR